MYVSICTKGHLDRSWQQLEGLKTIHDPNGISRPVGLVPDQPVPQGVLKKISQINLPLLSLETSETLQYEDL